MIKVIAVIGKSASGKDFLVKSALTYFPNLNPVIHYTTRPKRENEIDGKDYYFTEEKEFTNIDILSDTIFNSWHYILADNSFNHDKINIGVFNPQEIKYLINNHSDKFEIKVIELFADDELRYKRTLERLKVPFDDKGLKEMLRREQTDSIDFSEKNLREIKRIKLKSEGKAANHFNLGYIAGLLSSMDYSN